MKKLLIALSLSLLASSASAQLTKTQLNTEINAQLIDNTQGLITPAILRSVLHDMVNSSATLADPNTITGGVVSITTGGITLSELNSISWASGAVVLQEVGGSVTFGMNTANQIFSITSSDGGAQGASFQLYSNSPSPAVNDVIGSIFFLGNDNAASGTLYSYIQSVINDTTNGAETAQLNFYTISSGSYKILTFSGVTNALIPNTPLALGLTSAAWTSLALAASSTINFAASDVIITHSTNALSFTGASNGYNFDAGISTKAPVTKTGTSGSQATDDSSLIFNASGTYTLTLQSAASFSGRWLYVKNIAAQTVNSASSNVVPLAGGSAGTALLSNTAGKWAILQSDGTNWIIMAAN